MNHTSLRRRLVVGAAGLVLGAAGTLATASPAYAHHPVIEGGFVCDQTTGEWVVSWDLSTAMTSFDAIVVDLITSPADPDLEAAVEGQVIANGESIPVEQRVAGDSGIQQVSLSIVVDFVDPQDHSNVKESGRPAGPVTVVFDGVCEKGDGGGGEKPPGFPADVVFPAATCDFLIFFLINEDIEQGVSYSFTPNQDAVHGHGPDFLEFAEEIRDNPGAVVEIPDSLSLITDGEGVGPIAAGETVGPLGPFGPGDGFPAGDRHAHGFEAAEGLAVDVDVFVGQGDEMELVLEQTVPWSGEGLECDEDEGGDDGQGGELPKTGSSTMLIAGGAVALLVLGGGLYLIARRRRFTFTA